MKQYLLVDLKQGTDEWLRWRQQGIGASDAPTIMSENPWCSPQDLLREKLNPQPQRRYSAAMAQGTAMEPEARAEYCARTGIRMTPACMQHVESGWLRASVDGLAEGEDHVVEIKCGAKSYEIARGGKVASYYYAQLQHILKVTGLPAIDYWAYRGPKSGILIPVKRDEAYIEKLVRVEQEFWDSLTKPCACEGR